MDSKAVSCNKQNIKEQSYFKQEENKDCIKSGQKDKKGLEDTLKNA